ncbi:hypothetical protein C483_17043 [Natrialba hulunbeirensis JCM 10989]|uniref:Uncharacterized protein n=1 Tax=Natrialba hulunbeirensis JCM 10989 TaxID=1227493 RepID=L9ZNI4_9EURY|nr:hypothetical protein [Natrialba hulunbeirensis]ELY87626.1 hypothetical protein C483_17043 [Natrialba hulunbeirensis JCM 10989]
MDRRTLLTAASVGTISTLSGCLADTTDDAVLETGSADIEWPNVTVSTTIGDEELAAAFAFEGKVTRQPTAANPPQLTLEVRNDGDDPYEVEIPYPYPWRHYGGIHANEAAAIHLIPDDTENLSADPDQDQPDEWVPEAPTDGCWTAKTEIRPVWPDVGYPTVELHPGEQKGGTFTVLSSPRNNMCFPRGTYEFSDERLTIGHPEDAALDLTLRLSVTDSE